MEQLRAVVSGRVQMVMFRDFAQRMAKVRNLTGEVHNLPDGTVHIVAEGERAKLDEYLKKLRGGPLLAKVERVDATFAPAEHAFTDFSIRYE